MPDLSASQAKIAGDCVRRFRERLNARLLSEIKRQLAGFEPPAVREMLSELDVIENQLARSATSDRPTTAVHDVHASLLKQVILAERRALATEISEPRSKTHDRDAIRYLESRVRVLDEILAEPWFLEARAARMPRASDFVSIHFAAEGLPTLEPRRFDEKFGILEAPGLFPADMAFYRAHAWLRGLGVAVVFLDIDEFKKFNTNYGEVRVDRDILPRFMSVLEAHVFARGHAYRFGGDEYVLLLPNCDDARAIASCRALQATLAETEYPGIEPVPTVSIGLYVADPDCPLTNGEILERANRGKALAKEHRGDIVHYPKGADEPVRVG